MAQGYELKRWPDWLKPALVDGFQVEVQDLRVKSETEVGTIQRIEFPGVDRATASGSLWLDSISANWFEAFEKITLKQGTRWFWFPLWVGGNLAMHKVRFTERLKWGEKDGQYSVYSFTLEVGEREGLMPEWMVEFFLHVSPAWVLFVSNRLHHILHEEPGPAVTVMPRDIWRATDADWAAIPYHNDNSRLKYDKEA